MLRAPGRSRRRAARPDRPPRRGRDPALPARRRRDDRAREPGADCVHAPLGAARQAPLHARRRGDDRRRAARPPPRRVGAPGGGGGHARDHEDRPRRPRTRGRAAPAAEPRRAGRRVRVRGGCSVGPLRARRPRPARPRLRRFGDAFARGAGVVPDLRRGARLDGLRHLADDAAAGPRRRRAASEGAAERRSRGADRAERRPARRPPAGAPARLAGRGPPLAGRLHRSRLSSARRSSARSPPSTAPRSKAA